MPQRKRLKANKRMALVQESLRATTSSQQSTYQSSMELATKCSQSRGLRRALQSRGLFAMIVISGLVMGSVWPQRVAQASSVPTEQHQYLPQVSTGAPGATPNNLPTGGNQEAQLRASKSAEFLQQPRSRPQKEERRRFDPESETVSSGPQQQQQPTMSEKRAFVMELLKMLHEQYGSSGTSVSPSGVSLPPTTTSTTSSGSTGGNSVNKIEDRQSVGVNVPMMSQLMESIGADGDMKRLIDWVRNWFNLASLGEVTTQFVVSKLGSVNCPALLRPDKEELLVPRFLLFNEHYVDVPFELSINPSATECVGNAKFDPNRKTIVLIHGYLAGYTLVDGITNIKNRLLDLNKIANDRAIETFIKASAQASDAGPWNNNGTNYVFTEDLDIKIRSQMYNVIIIDWFNGANPLPRANYIRAAVNAQVVGKLIAKFLSALIVKCGSPAGNFQIIAHSLGCHVSGFTGKALNAAGHRLGKITHLDPIGLCFGRLFSRPQYRLSPDDALDTQAVHVSLNIFDNPLDGVHSNFLVNGGRDQLGCGGQSEVKNSTTSSVSLLFDPAAKFAPCSHLRALALFEDDHSSQPDQCQMVGYRCGNYDRFLAGKCGFCDAINSQCRLMSLPPIRMHFRRSSVAALPVPHSLMQPGGSLNSFGLPRVPYKTSYSHHLENLPQGSLDLYASGSLLLDSGDHSNAKTAHSEADHSAQSAASSDKNVQQKPPTEPDTRQSGHQSLAGGHQTSSGQMKTPREAPPNRQSGSDGAMGNNGLAGDMFGAPAYIVGQTRGNELRRRSDKRLSIDQGVKIAQALGKLRAETRSVLAEGLVTLRGGLREHLASSGSSPNSGDAGPEYSYASVDEGGAEEAPASPNEDHPSEGEADNKEESQQQQQTAPGQLDDPKGWTDGGGSSLQQLSDNNQTTQFRGKQPHQNIASTDQAAQRFLDSVDQIPIGGQAIPAGSLNMPLYFLGTGALSPFCVNYYQLRILIAESRLARLLQTGGLASNRLAPQLSQHTGGLVSAAATMQHRAQTAAGRDMLHVTVKLTDAQGHFFKGFSLLEHSRMLARVANDLTAQHPPVPMPFMAPILNEPLIEITMLLNTTSQQPVKVAESILSYYFHPIVLADRIEVNYMSNISPDVRARYSSLLCPVAINDKHQLVRYIECHKVAASSTTTSAIVSAS